MCLSGWHTVHGAAHCLIALWTRWFVWTEVRLWCKEFRFATFFVLMAFLDGIHFKWTSPAFSHRSIKLSQTLCNTRCKNSTRTKDNLLLLCKSAQKSNRMEKIIYQIWKITKKRSLDEQSATHSLNKRKIQKSFSIEISKKSKMANNFIAWTETQMNLLWASSQGNEKKRAPNQHRLYTARWITRVLKIGKPKI